MGKKGEFSSSAKPRSKYQRKYNSTPTQNKRRSNRNKARRAAKKAYGSRIKGKDIHHKDGNPNNNKKSNLAVQSVKKNRSNNKRRKNAKKTTK